eukprot:5506855-Prymnesium_polylepis.1
MAARTAIAAAPDGLRRVARLVLDSPLDSPPASGVCGAPPPHAAADGASPTSGGAAAASSAAA